MSFFSNLRRGFAENVRFGFSAMREHKLRSGLTIVGIVVGVATVIAMVAIVTGFNNNVIGNFQAFGASRIDFKKYRDRFGPPGARTEEERRRRNLTVGDVAAIRQACPEAAAVSTLAGYFDAEIHVKNGSAEANNPYVLGVDEFYPAATAYTIGQGRFFSPAEVEHGALAVVLGSDVREAIFPREHPIGKEITVNGLRYRVVGVLDKKGEQFGYSPDNKVVLPYKTFEHQFGFQIRQEGIHISAVPRRPEDVDLVIEKATSVLRQRRRIPFDKPNDFEIDTPDQMIGQFRAITGGVDPDRADLACCRRRRGDEHHARVGHAADAGDRNPQGGRRLAPRHRSTVLDRGRYADDARWDRRRRRRNADLGRRQGPGSVASDLGSGLVGSHGTSSGVCRRSLLRYLSGGQGLEARSDRGAAV
jgi:hypothetical protein